MIKPDVITTNATHTDFPMFRYQIRQYRHLYDRVILGFSEHHGGYNLTDSISKLVKPDDVIVIKAQVFRGRDWRDVAVNTALNKSKSDYVLFLEQDFIIKNIEMLEQIFRTSHPIVGFSEDNNFDRLHPAFLLIKRDMLNQTSMDFSAKPPEHDHFGRIWKDLLQMGVSYTLLEDMQFKSPDDWEHLAGITYNYSLLIQGKEVTFHKERFAEYNRKLLSLDIEQCPQFLSVIRKASRI